MESIPLKAALHFCIVQMAPKDAQSSHYNEHKICKLLSMFFRGQKGAVGLYLMDVTRHRKCQTEQKKNECWLIDLTLPHFSSLPLKAKINLSVMYLWSTPSQ